MRFTVVFLLVVAAASYGQDKKPNPDWPEPAADDVLAAFRAKDQAALKTLAQKDDPDPWLVAEELCFRGEHDAAEAFAKAAPRKDVEKLPAYVASRRGKPRNTAGRKALAAVNRAIRARDGKAALDAVETVDVKAGDVVSVRLIHSRGVAQLMSRRVEEASKEHLAAADAAERLGWLARTAYTLQASGTFAHQNSDERSALAAWERCHTIQKLRGNRAGAAEVRLEIGNLHARVGSFARALDCYERALELYEELGNRVGVSRALVRIGGIHLRLGNFAKALDYSQRSRKLMEKLGNPVGVAQALGLLGVIHQHLGSHAKALEYQERALKLATQLGNPAMVAEVLVAIGAIHINLGSYAKALEYQERALALYEAVGNRAGAAATLGNIGSIHKNLGSYAKALEYMERGLKLSETLGRRAGVAASLGNIGLIHQSLGDFAKALEYMERAQKITEELGDRSGIAASLINIGIIHHHLGAHAKALESYERGLKLAETIGHQQWRANALANIGSIHQDLGAHSKALEYYERAQKHMEELGDRVGAARVLADIGDVHQARGNLEEARRCLERSARVARSLRVKPLHVAVLGQLARHHLDAGKPSRALGRAREALREIEGLLGGLGEEQGAGAREQHAELFAVGTLAAVREEDAAEALTFLESGRAGALIDALGKREALRWKAESLPPELRRLDLEAQANERAARRGYDAAVKRGKRKEIRAAAQALDDATEAVREVAGRIQRELKQQARLFYPRAETIDTIESALEEDQALVLYGLCLDEAVALVLRHDGERIVSLAKAADITAACETFDATDLDVDPTAALGALRKLLVDRLELRVDTKRVLVSPEGPLCYLPFGALFTQPVAMTPSGTTHVLLLNEERAEGEGILALGDPDYKGASKGAQAIYYRGGTLSPLPGTRKEAEAIGTTTLLGAKASEAGLYKALPTAERWRAVHFGCHGLVNVEQPMLSSLALAREGDHDGFLTALEVLRTKIPADLAVLSACETARGKIVKGEGIVGLTRAFMFAGTPRVICSLWKVDDEATQALMVKFYELWKTQPTAIALKNAQAFVRGHEKWKHPYYWAAWQLWGLGD